MMENDYLFLIRQAESHNSLLSYANLLSNVLSFRFCLGNGTLFSKTNATFFKLPFFWRIVYASESGVILYVRVGNPGAQGKMDRLKLCFFWKRVSLPVKHSGLIGKGCFHKMTTDGQLLVTACVDRMSTLESSYNWCAIINCNLV